jgi:hypothetical protein
MLVAFRLGGLSAREAHYVGVDGRVQCGADARPLCVDPPRFPQVRKPRAGRSAIVPTRRRA